jgi:UDP-galactopyranose mutase
MVTTTSTAPLLVFSHLRWDFVYQRPQHLLSRLARFRPVYVIEEPVHDPEAAPHWERSRPAPGVTICRPHSPVAEPGFSNQQIPVLRPLIAELLAAEGLERYVVWLYTPMAFPLAYDLSPEAVVYDCMDELSMFLNAPPEMLERETGVLAWADVVFTGGPSLYRAKLGRHENLHCFPSSVEMEHFRQALPQTGTATAEPVLPEPADQAALPHPRLGFYGVIDERMDLELLAAMADQHPEWQIVLVGPVVKIDPAHLPRRPNLHYLGQRAYAELPAYLGGWAVCLLPFALNDATRFISPTKTLEYMAAERMIASTPIADVAEPYGDIVFLGQGVVGFIAACEQALAVSPEARAARIEKMRGVLQQTSWNMTARAMEFLIDEALEKRQEAKALPAAVLNTRQASEARLG